MCFERTTKKVEPFHIGYRLVFRVGDQYAGVVYALNKYSVAIGEWVDEMPYRFADELLLETETSKDVGWHVFSSIQQAKGAGFGYDAIVCVECYGTEAPYGYGLIDGKPAGRFQFMKILEEVK